MPSPISQESHVSSKTFPAIDLVAIAAQDELQTSDLWKLSDVSLATARDIRARWSTLPADQRFRLVANLVELAESSVEAHFHRIFRIALEDEEAPIRALAVEGLWEDEDPELAPTYAAMLEHDPDIDVRAGAAAAIRPHLVRLIENDADTSQFAELFMQIATLIDEPPLVRRRCIESAGVIGDDPGVEQLIVDAFADGDQTIVAGAIRAMGFSQDPKWLATLEREMESEDAELRFEAAGAAGFVGDSRLVPGLTALVLDEDVEVRAAAVAALGKIGGPPALRVLRNVLEDEDVEDIAAVEEAIVEAQLVENPLANLD